MYVVAKKVFCFESKCTTFKITEREKEIIKHCLKGCSNTEIATLLFISESTVKHHLKNIFIKMNIKNRFQLIQLFSN